ncbi:MAG: porin [Gemmatimonadetes bacterium]|nr:porin [Gemmatimonadota bacterium]
MRRQIEAITRELEELKLGREVVAAADTGLYGLGPAASKVYRARQGVSIGGYGEFVYENLASENESGAPSGQLSSADALRGIVYVGYKFGDRLLFNSEIEFEHGSTEQGGSTSVEFAYLDYRLSDRFGVRGGLLLTPMGFLNELHEPPIFLGTTRPETERAIIPSTWRENGIGVFGEAGKLVYRAYLINSFDAVGGGSSRAAGFSASGLRGGRQNGARALAEDFAGVARVDVTPVLGLLLGTSVYYGQSGQGRPHPTDRAVTLDVPTFIWEGHAQYRAQGFDVRGLLAVATLDEAVALNVAKGLKGNASVGERLVGGYLQLGYDVLRRLATEHQLIPYVRYEALNTQASVPSGFQANPANDRAIISLGAAWKPIPNVVVKGDYQIQRNQAETGLDRLVVALGYLF